MKKNLALPDNFEGILSAAIERIRSITAEEVREADFDSPLAIYKYAACSKARKECGNLIYQYSKEAFKISNLFNDSTRPWSNVTSIVDNMTRLSHAEKAEFLFDLGVALRVSGQCDKRFSYFLIRYSQMFLSAEIETLPKIAWGKLENDKVAYGFSFSENKCYKSKSGRCERVYQKENGETARQSFVEGFRGTYDMVTNHYACFEIPEESVPFLGIINIDTRFKSVFHTNLVQVLHPKIQNQLKLVHGIISSPVSICNHDILHINYRKMTSELINEQLHAYSHEPGHSLYASLTSDEVETVIPLLSKLATPELDRESYQKLFFENEEKESTPEIISQLLKEWFSDAHFIRLAFDEFNGWINWIFLSLNELRKVHRALDYKVHTHKKVYMNTLKEIIAIYEEKVQVH